MSRTATTRPLVLLIALAGSASYSCKANEEPGGPGVGGDGGLPGDGGGQGALGGIKIVELSGGQRHTCGRGTSGEVVCWGSNRHGQLGSDGQIGDSQIGDSGTVRVAGLDDALAISAGTFHACAVRRTGAVACWGSNDYGQLGDGTIRDDRAAPVPVSGLNDAVAIGLGNTHSCAVRASGAVVCWGRNDSGQLGDGTTDSSRQPVAVVGLTNVEEVRAGASHTCARRASGEVLCWGNNDIGRLGNGEPATPGFTPQIGAPVTDLTDAVALRVGESHGCALRADGTVRCWGNNSSGQLGDGIPGYPKLTPVAVVDLVAVAEISLGGLHSCARLESGALWCWGDNSANQLGADEPQGAAVVHRVTVVDTAVAFGSGYGHTCAARADGTVRCWGRGREGQAPDPVPGLGPTSP